MFRRRLLAFAMFGVIAASIGCAQAPPAAPDTAADQAKLQADALIWFDHYAKVDADGMATSVALFPVATSAPQPPPGRSVLSMRHLAFRADSENFARVQDELRTRHIAFESQDHGISHSIYFRDPNGHEIEITTYDLKPRPEGP